MYEDKEYTVKRRTAYGRYWVTVTIDAKTHEQYIEVYNRRPVFNYILKGVGFGRDPITAYVIDYDDDVDQAIFEIIDEYEKPLKQMSKVKQADEYIETVRRPRKAVFNDVMTGESRTFVIDHNADAGSNKKKTKKKKMTARQLANLKQNRGLSEYEILKRHQG